MVKLNDAEYAVLGLLVYTPLSVNELAEQLKEQRIQLGWHENLIAHTLDDLCNQGLAEAKGVGWIITEKGCDLYRSRGLSW